LYNKILFSFVDLSKLNWIVRLLQSPTLNLSLRIQCHFNWHPFDNLWIMIINLGPRLIKFVITFLPLILQQWGHLIVQWQRFFFIRTIHLFLLFFCKSKLVQTCCLLLLLILLFVAQVYSSCIIGPLFSCLKMVFFIF